MDEMLTLLPEEIEYLQDEIKRDRRCHQCGHLFTLHQYNGGTDECVICGCGR